jgi:chromosome segregation ATPase
MNWGLVLQAGGVIGGLVVLIGLPWQIRKVKAETRKTSVDAAEVLIKNALVMLEPASGEIGRLEARLKAASERVASLEAEVQGLRNQVGAMTKEIIELRDENGRLREGQL